jgi:transcriptional regulator with XRE-family HTH domain
VDEPILDINTRIATRLVELRHETRWSIDELAARSGVSRAMISKIERGESSPTANVLNKLSIGFGITLPALFGASGYNQVRVPERNPMSLRANQPEWRDAETGYRRRTLTPASALPTVELSEVLLPAGQKVILETHVGATGAQHQLWMLEGSMELRLGSEIRLLAAGDCIVLTHEGPANLRNPGRTKARYLLAVSAPARHSPGK